MDVKPAPGMTWAELVAYHEKHIASCEAYAKSEDDDVATGRRKNRDKQTDALYSGRAIWHRAAIDLIKSVSG